MIGYVNFAEIHKIINHHNYYEEKKKKMKEKLLQMAENFEENRKNIYDLNTFFDYFENEFKALDERTKSIIKAEITRITNIFISDYEINKIFCPSENEINFEGLKNIIDKGNIVVLNMNISKYGELSKIIATYLKLDFQTEVLMSLEKKEKERITVFLCDEYQEYVTKNDSDFYAQSREAKCINIISTQSYSSIKEKIKDVNISDVILQNLVNKICFRTDDEYTITKLQNLIGKEYKEKISKTIGESAKDTSFNYIFNDFVNMRS